MVYVKIPFGRKDIIKPCLAGLDYVRGKYPTPYGAVTVEHKKDESGKIVTSVDAPKEIEIEVCNL